MKPPADESNCPGQMTDSVRPKVTKSSSTGRKDMASRDRNVKDKVDAYDYCVLQVQLTKQDAPVGTGDQMRLVTIDNNFDTLRFVQENLNACISNLVMLQRIEERAKQERRRTGR
jgi:hypothetical protein